MGIKAHSLTDALVAMAILSVLLPSVYLALRGGNNRHQQYQSARYLHQSAVQQIIDTDYSSFSNISTNTNSNNSTNYGELTAESNTIHLVFSNNSRQWQYLLALSNL